MVTKVKGGGLGGVAGAVKGATGSMTGNANTIGKGWGAMSAIKQKATKRASPAMGARLSRGR